MREGFRKLAQALSEAMGSAGAFLTALGIVLVWICTGPMFHYSDTWQLVINTGTSVITFLMVFLIQNSQSRDTRAIQLKLDELLRSAKRARNELVNLEELSDAELDTLREEFAKLAGRAKPVTGEGGKSS
ncbi:MAG TPA: low affinity iron permease family protein [Bryobacteraceae bacterium]|nr:low affinity iron permease family protein [Bryobacteraceae bacterium]